MLVEDNGDDEILELQPIKLSNANPRTHPSTTCCDAYFLQRKARLARKLQEGGKLLHRKSINFTEFVESIGQLGSYWLGLNEEPPR